MASEKTRALSTMLVIPDPRVSIDTANSSFTQAGSRPGVPVAQNDTGMVLQATGSQSADGGLEVQTLRGGYPYAQSAAEGASYVWREDGDSDTSWRGWDVPNVISGWEALQWTDGSGNLKLTKNPHAITLPSGTVLCAYQVHEDVGGLGTVHYLVRVQGRPVGASWGSAVDVVDWTAAPTVDFHPCLVLLESGRVMLYHWVYDSVTDTAQIRAMYSDDDGATWAVAQDYCLDVAVNDVSVADGAGAAGFDPKNIRAASVNGQVLLVPWLHAHNTSLTWQERVWQYASADGGVTFRLIDTPESGDSYEYPDVVVVDGRFVMTYLGDDDDGNFARPVASAFDKGLLAGSAVAVKYQISSLELDHACTAVDETGYLYHYGWNEAKTACYAYRSLDTGVTWEQLGITTWSGVYESWWYYQADGAIQPRDMAATASEGRIVIAHNWDASVGNEGDSLAVYYMGGYSTTTMPGFVRFPIDTRRVTWFWTWLPYDLPQDAGWTPNVAGGTATLQNGHLEVVTAPAQRDWYLTPSSAIDEPIITEVHVKVGAGGSIVADDVSFMVRLDDGAEGYQVTVRMDVSGGSLRYQLRDDIAAANIGIVQSVGAEEAVIRLALGRGSVQVWHRERDLLADRDWTVGPSSTSLTDSSGASGNNRIAWGHRASTSSTSSWWGVFLVDNAWAGEDISTGQTNPDELFGRPYSATGTYVTDGVVVSALDGPTIRADRWDIDVRYEYGIERIWDYSPRRRWRSTDTSAQVIVLDLSSVAADSWVGEALYVGLYGTTLSQATVRGYTGSGWVAIGTAEAHESLDGLKWDRIGDTIRPETSSQSTETPWLNTNEVAGGYFQLDATTSRTILSQRQGKWTNSTQVKPWLTLDGVDNATDPTTGTAGRIVPKSWGFILHTRGVRYEKLEITQPAAAAGVPGPPAGYWELGAIVVGAVIPMSEAPSWGRVVEEQSSAEVIESRDWTISTYTPVPGGRRIMERAWSDAWDHTNSSGYDADPAYFELDSNASAEPAANIRSPGTQMQGVFREVGQGTPVAWLESVPVATSQLQVINRYDLHMLARLSQQVRLEQVQGTPGSTDVWRIPTISLTELV